MNGRGSGLTGGGIVAQDEGLFGLPPVELKVPAQLQIAIGFR